jgi:signal transduction histidine kinase
MRIQTRLFLGTTLLVLSLMLVQWWIHERQMKAIEREIGTVATSVGRHFLLDSMLMVPENDPGSFNFKVSQNRAPAIAEHNRFLEDVEVFEHVSEDGDEHKVKVMMVGKPGSTEEAEISATWSQRLKDGTPALVELFESIEVPEGAVMAWQAQADQFTVINGPTQEVLELDSNENESGEGTTKWRGIRRIELRVVRPEESTERVLVVSGDPVVDAEIPIPIAPTVERFKTTLGQGLSVSLGLLALGMVASAVMANRLSRPLRDLASRAEALGTGELGVEVPVTTVGEIAELQSAFNRMSRQLATLEMERENWRRKEHLAELGDLARGLAHTVRNPLNTLGLAVEELGSGHGRSERLVETARSQIRRIDRWLRSFLAVGAGDMAERQVVDFVELVQSVVLETIQQGGKIELEAHEDGLVTRIVPDAVRSAIVNLIENAIEASPKDEGVFVSVARDAGQVRIEVEDHGEGLTDEVKNRLFSPHVTTKVAGSGMGLFLARQLIVGMHGGRLEVEDREGGGTVASVFLDLHDAEDEPNGRSS